MHESIHVHTHDNDTAVRTSNLVRQMLEDYEYDLSVQKLNALPATMGGCLSLEQEIEQERCRLKEPGRPPLTPIDQDWYDPACAYAGGCMRVRCSVAGGQSPLTRRVTLLHRAVVVHRLRFSA